MKAKFGAMLVDGRGKLGGHVFSKNRGGSYVRTKVSPVNPQTTYQSAVRSLFSTLSQNWRGLTPVQRSAWDSAVSNFTSTDVFGDVKTPTGKNLYLKLNANLDLVDVSPISTPPLPAGAGSVDTLSIAADASASTLTITFTPTPVPADTAFLVEATAQVSAGKSFLKNKYRVLTYIDAAGTSPLAAGTLYETRFGDLTTGLKLGVRLTPINKVTGEKGVPLAAETIVVA